MMTCQRCRRQMPDDALVCPSCGTPTSAVQTNAQPSPHYYGQEPLKGYSGSSNEQNVPLHSEYMGSGSLEQDGPLGIVAMKKEKQTGGRSMTTGLENDNVMRQNGPDAAAGYCSTARHGRFLPSLFPQLYAARLGSSQRTLPRSP